MLVTRPAPDFKAVAIMGDNSFKEISLAGYKGKKVVLFFYPLDFTFVCPTEILAFNHRLADFEKRGVQVIGCSVDSKWSHYGWKNTDIKNGGIGDIKYPILADIEKKIARSYDVLKGSTPAAVLTEDGEEETTVNGDEAGKAQAENLSALCAPNCSLEKQCQPRPGEKFLGTFSFLHFLPA
jgi:peroxiredoxin (alkyl hydroperoxide reductase subunit C)